ncbi:MAG: hypothetical protein IJC55_00635 [Clostridia bacterium]|nr:hypothetical protein [Clostridia bacterium]
MKSYDQTVDAVFDRIRDYNVKKKRRTVLACRITAACCAVSLLGGSMWYLNRPTHDIPGSVPDDTPQTTTATKKPLIVVDTEDTIGSNNPQGDSDGYIPNSFEETPIKQSISPSLQEKMEQHRNDDVIYAVIAEILITRNDIDHFNNTSGFTETNKEMIQLSEKLWEAYTAYVDAPPEDPTQKYSTVPTPEKLADYYAIREKYLELLTKLYGNVDEIENKAIRSRTQESLAHLAYQDAMVEWRTFISTTDVITDEARLPYIMKISQTHEDIKTFVNKCDSLRTQMLNEYLTLLRSERFASLTAFCDTAPIEFTSDTLTGYYVELSADAINSLAENGYYSFRMASPDGSVEADWYNAGF